MYSALPLLSHAKYLFPICRSITGKGARDTLKYFENFHPEYKRIIFNSGTKVYDWEIPNEWNIKDAYLEHLETGKKYAQFKNSNLHIVGYSQPVNKIIDLEELKNKIFTQKEQPDLIPYVTSYYSVGWGFCMTDKEKNKLPKGKYRVFIDSSLVKGALDISHAYLKGSSKKEIFFSSYICHPSMANNELSGPVVLNAILDYVKNKYPFSKFSYRFVMLPETIGSIAYLSRFSKEMKKNMFCGFNLSCVGDNRSFSYVQSPYSNTIADNALSSALRSRKNVKIYSFLDRGSDERQYCSPGIDLPLCTFCRTKFGEYPEYHTSADNFKVVTEEGLEGSLNVMKEIIDAFETCMYPKLFNPCEPQLGKRGLYPNISQKRLERSPIRARTDILAFCNGKNTVFEISDLTKLSLRKVINELEILLKAKVIFDSNDS